MTNSKDIKIHLAPMEGVVDYVVRDLISQTGAIDFCVTEFFRINSGLYPKKVYYRNNPELAETSKTKSGTPVIFQILGSDLNAMAENAAQIADCGAIGIDINFGCPAKTVNKHDGGATLLKNPDRLFKVTEAVRRAVPADVPVTTKVRLGFDHKNFHKEIALACEAAGSSRLAIHARTKEEGYRAPAHWEYIAYMKSEIKIPVVANGEIWTLEDFIKCQNITGCDEFMLGRGLMANPYLAIEIKSYLKHGAVIKTEFLELKNYLFEFLKLSFQYRGEPYAVTRLKQLLKQMTKSFPEAFELFDKIKTIKKYAEIELLLNHFFQNKSQL